MSQRFLVKIFLRIFNYIFSTFCYIIFLSCRYLRGSIRCRVGSRICQHLSHSLSHDVVAHTITPLRVRCYSFRHLASLFINRIVFSDTTCATRHHFYVELSSRLLINMPRFTGKCFVWFIIIEALLIILPTFLLPSML